MGQSVRAELRSWAPDLTTRQETEEVHGGRLPLIHGDGLPRGKPSGLGLTTGTQAQLVLWIPIAGAGALKRAHKPVQRLCGLVHLDQQAHSPDTTGRGGGAGPPLTPQMGGQLFFMVCAPWRQNAVLLTPAHTDLPREPGLRGQWLQLREERARSHPCAGARPGSQHHPCTAILQATAGGSQQMEY